jgi:LmbE family N-acetylglucosaminyl deacetylase
MPERRAFAIGAHPDDVEIYCLGLLLRLQDAGWTVGWAVATDGQAGMPAGSPIGLRRDEALAAGATFGVEPALLGLMDGQLIGAPEEARAVRTAIATFRPTVLITHAGDDYHPDHRTLSRLVAEACPPEAALLFAEPMLGGGATPELLVDITDQQDRKRAALAAHTSQSAPEFLPALDTWSRFRALHCGVRGACHAEGFFIQRSVASAANTAELLRATLPGPGR